MDPTHREVYTRKISLKFNHRSNLYFVLASHLQACLPAVLSISRLYTRVLIQEDRAFEKEPVIIWLANITIEIRIQ
jgi:hypothetical protein